VLDPKVHEVVTAEVPEPLVEPLTTDALLAYVTPSVPKATEIVVALPFGVKLVVRAKDDELFVTLTRHSWSVSSARPLNESPEAPPPVPLILS
jgi:hypothetical protein